MPNSVLEAIKMGLWDFEPNDEPRVSKEFPPTSALPGTEDKLNVLAERVRLGLPLWHDRDRLYFETVDQE